MKKSTFRSPFALSLVFSFALLAGLSLILTIPPQHSLKATITKHSRNSQQVRATQPTEPAFRRKPLLRSKQQPNSAQIDRAQLPKAYDQPGEAAEFFRLKRLPEGATELPVEKYFEAQEQMRQMPQYSTAEDRLLPARSAMTETELAALPAWTSLGPGNVGGRTRALLIHPTNPSVMYVAGVAGGVWKTTTGGANWTPIGDLLPNIAVCSLAMDPKNPNVVYAGTGEGFFNIDGIRGAGIFKTADGGATWTRLASTTTEDFYFVNDIVISPTNSQRLYAATSTGVWRSLDGGATWARTLKPVKTNSSSELVLGGCLDLAARTDKATDYLFAACGTILDQGTVYRNIDAAGSNNWTPVLSEYGMGRASLAIAPSDQSVVYASAANIFTGSYQDGLHAVFRSLSSGDAGTWTGQVRHANPIKLNTVLFSNPLVAFQTECGLGENNFFASQGWYDNAIAVDPLNPNVVFVGGIDLFRSDDGGVNWGLASHWWADKKAPQYAHADHHALVFHPQYNGASNQTLFIATDGGIFRTDNARAATAIGATAPCNPANSAVVWTSLNNGYAVTQFYHGMPYPDGTSYFGGTQDNGTLRSTDASGANNWKEILGGDGGFVAIDPTNPSILYASNPGRQIKKSLDGGTIFNLVTSGINDEYGLFINPFMLDPADPQRLWTGGGYIWRSDNGAISWQRASTLTTGRGVVSAIASAPTDVNFTLAGMSEGQIHFTNSSLTNTEDTNWGYRWPRRGYVSWVAFDPVNANIAYATYSSFGGGSHVWRTSNAGQDWTEIDGSGAGRLPDIPVHCIVVDPVNPAHLYIGTDLGVFVSTSSGESWAVENTGFANAPTESLALNTANGTTTLFAFTHGRGAWRVNTGSPGCNFTLSATGQSFNTSGGAGNVNVTAATGCNWTANVKASGASWITINSGASGTGSGTVTFTVAANNDASSRTGTVAIAGKSFVVRQEGVKCVITLASGSQTFATGGGTGSVNVSTSKNCYWEANSQANWITGVSVSGNGNGNGMISFTVAANNATQPRVGEIAVRGIGFEGQIFRVTQDGAGSGCTYAITPASQSFAATSGTGSVNVTVGSGCNWTASSSANWITINSGSSGNGNGLVNFTVATNVTSATRSGAINVAGQVFTVTQGGRACPPSPLTPGQIVNGNISMSDCARPDTFSSALFYYDHYSFTASAGQLAQFSVTTSGLSTSLYLIDPAGKVTSYYDGFVSLPLSGTYIFEVAGYYASTYGDYTLRMSTGTPGCTYSITPDQQSIGPSGGTKSVQVNASSGCGWQAYSPASWITVNSGSTGSGSGTVNYTVAPNTSSGPREGKLVIAGKSLTVNQVGTGIDCRAMPISPGQTVSNTQFTGSVCTSPDISDRDIRYNTHRYSFNGFKGQAVEISLAPNNANNNLYLLGPDGSVVAKGGRRIPDSEGLFTLPASGNYFIDVTLTIPFGGTYSMALSSLSSGCSISTPLPTRYVAANSSSDTVSVIASSSNCAWTALSTVDWITINSGNNGVGSGTVSYQVAANSANSSRTGALKIAGQTVVITQAGTTCPQPIVYGQTVNGDLKNGSCSRHSFNGTVGQPIAFSVTALDSFTPYLRLIAPNGSEAFSNSNQRGDKTIDSRGFITLEQSGVYILQVDYNGTFSSQARYNLSLDTKTLNCTYFIPTNRQSVTSAGGTASITVTTGNRCVRYSFSQADWITINSGSGFGSGTVSFTVLPNAAKVPRSGTITVAGQIFTIDQSGDGSGCTVTSVTLGQTISGNLDDNDCRSPLRGSGAADRYSFSGTAGQPIALSLSGFYPALFLLNPDGSILTFASDPRNVYFPQGSGFFTLPTTGTYLIEVTSYDRAAYSLSLSTIPTCSVVVAPGNQSFEAGGSTGSLNITTGNNCNWVATSNATWITTTSSGSGNGAINFSVAANFGSTPRTGALNIAGQTVTITQAGRHCTATPITIGQVVNGSLSAGDCRSLVLDSPDFRTDRYSFSGVAGQAVVLSLYSPTFDPYLYLIGPNGVLLAEDDDGGSGLNARIPGGTGSFVLSSSGIYTIEVASFDAIGTGNYALSLGNAAVCAWAVSPLEPSRFAATGGSDNITVSCADGCEWAATSQASWITLTTGASGIGTGSVTFNVAPNTSAQGRSGTLNVAGQIVTITQAATVASVSAASFSGAQLAPESIVAAFGGGLATTTLVATTVPLPTTLAGTTVKVRDSAGVERAAPLFFVAPTQVNYLMPVGTAAGTATVTITSGDGNVATGVVQIASVAPGLFSANASGTGLAAATLLRVKADGSQIYEPVTRFDPAQNKIVAVPIDLGSETDQVFLLLFGSGFTKPSALAAVSCSIGGTSVETLYAGPQGDFVGLDQTNVRLPRILAGRGEVDVVLTVDSKTANTVKVSIK